MSLAAIGALVVPILDQSYRPIVGTLNGIIANYRSIQLGHCSDTVLDVMGRLVICSSDEHLLLRQAASFQVRLQLLGRTNAQNSR
jgi:hypothetical protein